MQLDHRIKQALYEVIDTQIAIEDPPEIGATFSRLLNDGHNKEQAYELIGCVVLSEVFDVMKNGDKFDMQRYIAALQNLPQLPEDKI